MLDRYQITQQLGEGGAGSVYKAWDQKLKRYVALKHLLPPDQREASAPGIDLAAEAAALSALQNPHIVSVYDFDTDGPEPFVVMEYLNGETLDQTILRGALMQNDFEKVALETLDGLTAAHKAGLAHRDLKPGNIMFHWLDGDGGFILKLLDFGLANQGSRLAQQETTDSGTVAGSVHFMAPEQFLHQPIDFRADLYSLGCVFYYTLTASFPFTGATVDEVTRAHLSHQVLPLGELRPDVNPLMSDWVMWLMSRQPEERPESAAEALKAFRGIMDGSLQNLPGRRVLKTHSMNKFEKGMAPAPEGGTARIQLPRGHTQPVNPSAAPRRPSASVSNDTHPSVRAPQKQEGNGKLYGLIAAAAAVLGGAIFMVSSKGKDTKASASVTEGETTKDTTAKSSGAAAKGEAKQVAVLATDGISKTQQVHSYPGGLYGTGLVLYYNANQGPMKDKGLEPARLGDVVGHWNDTATLGGNNICQYYATGTADTASFWPELVEVSGSGLAKKEFALNFDNSKMLVAGRDSRRVGDTTGNFFTGNAYSWFIVMNPKRSTAKQCALDCNNLVERRVWYTEIRDGQVFTGGYKGTTAQETSLPLPADGFVISGGVWNGGSSELVAHLVDSQGNASYTKPLTATLVAGAMDGVRVGATRQPTTVYFDGPILSLLVYNTALSTDKVKSVQAFLSERYFGKKLK